MIGAIIMGAICGWIAGQLMGVEGGLLKNILLGIVGSFVGSLAIGILGFSAHGLIADLIVGVAGACLFIWLARKFLK